MSEKAGRLASPETRRPVPLNGGEREMLAALCTREINRLQSEIGPHRPGGKAGHDERERAIRIDKLRKVVYRLCRVESARREEVRAAIGRRGGGRNGRD